MPNVHKLKKLRHFLLKREWDRVTSAMITDVSATRFRGCPKLCTRCITSGLEHEWVHLKDASTVFGWFPFLPRWVNTKIYRALYLFPQILAPLAIAGIWHPVFLGCLIFLAPLPAPFRAYSEARAFRRSLELGAKYSDVEKLITGPRYYWSMPLSKIARGWLAGPSPYKDFMNARREATTSHPR